jgi:hypothetical protein
MPVKKIPVDNTVDCNGCIKLKCGMLALFVPACVLHALAQDAILRHQTPTKTPCLRHDFTRKMQLEKTIVRCLYSSTI